MTYRSMIIAAAAAITSIGAAAAGNYGPGVSDAEIKLGQTIPYSGPVSAYGTVGRTEEAYFNMINSKGGVNGRKIRMISLDDAYSPPKTVEQTRKLVEQEEVLAIVGTIGTPTNSATQRYLNAKKVPSARSRNSAGARSITSSAFRVRLPVCLNPRVWRPPRDCSRRLPSRRPPTRAGLTPKTCRNFANF
jgi:ABC-type branched-subunit amino acid transport system substrate-binding protein